MDRKNGERSQQSSLAILVVGALKVTDLRMQVVQQVGWDLLLVLGGFLKNRCVQMQLCQSELEGYEGQGDW